MSDNFVKIAQKNRIIKRKIARNKNELKYEAYKVDLVINKEDKNISNLFKHSSDKEQKIKML